MARVCHQHFWQRTSSQKPSTSETTWKESTKQLLRDSKDTELLPPGAISSLQSYADVLTHTVNFFPAKLCWCFDTHCQFLPCKAMLMFWHTLSISSLQSYADVLTHTVNFFPAKLCWCFDTHCQFLPCKAMLIFWHRLSISSLQSYADVLTQTVKDFSQEKKEQSKQIDQNKKLPTDVARLKILVKKQRQLLSELKPEKMWYLGNKSIHLPELRSAKALQHKFKTDMTNGRKNMESWSREPAVRNRQVRDLLGE